MFTLRDTNLKGKCIFSDKQRPRTSRMSSEELRMIMLALRLCCMHKYVYFVYSVSVHRQQRSYKIVNPEILSKNWPIYRERINAEQWFISHKPESCNLKGKKIHPAWDLI